MNNKSCVCVVCNEVNPHRRLCDGSVGGEQVHILKPLTKEPYNVDVIAEGE